MTSPTITLSDGSIAADGQVLLRDVPGEIQAETEGSDGGLFLVARAESSSSRLLFALGSIPALSRFTLCHRYEPFWMKPKAGTRLAEVPPETQFFLGQLHDDRWLLIVPLVGEAFRFSLRGRKDDSLELLAETGDAFAPGLGGLAVYVAVGPESILAGAQRRTLRLGPPALGTPSRREVRSRLRRLVRLVHLGCLLPGGERRQGPRRPARVRRGRRVSAHGDPRRRLAEHRSPTHR